MLRYPTGKQIIVFLIFVAVAGWAMIEVLLWLLSFITG